LVKNQRAAEVDDPISDYLCDCAIDYTSGVFCFTFIGASSFGKVYSGAMGTRSRTAGYSVLSETPVKFLAIS